MPRTEDIEKFNQDLIKTGREPEVSRARGEEIERVLTPEEYPMDHNGPLAKVRKPSTNVPADATDAGDGEQAEGSGDQSTDDFLAGLVGGDEGDAPKKSGTDGFDDLFDLGPSDSQTSEDTPSSGPAFDDLFDDDLLGSMKQTEVEEPIADEPIDDLATDDLSAENEADTDAFLDSFENQISNEEPNVDEPETPPTDVGTFDEPSTDDHAGIDVPDMDDFGSFDEPLEVSNSDDTFGLNDLEESPPKKEKPAAGDDFGSEDFGLGDLGDFSDPADKPSDPPVDDLGFDDAPIEDTEPVADEEPLFGTPDFGSFDDEPAGPGDSGDLQEPPDMTANLEADFGTDDFPEEFSMGDFEKEFGVMDDVAPKVWEPQPDPKEEKDVETEDAALVDDAEHFTITLDDYKLILESLGNMPLNLKIAAEEVLGNSEKPFAQVKQLIEAMIDGQSPVALAPIVSRLYGKKIKIPPGYAKKTGEAFERERNSFSYKFRTTILPLIRTIVLSALALFFVGWLVVRFIITPAIANGLYEDGLKAIALDKYDEGNKLFDDAYKTWPDNDRFVQYGEAFAIKDQDVLAYSKYKELLGDLDPKQTALNMPKEYKDYYLNDLLPKLQARDKKEALQWLEGADRNHVKGIMSFSHFLVEDYDRPIGKYETKYVEAIMYLERLIQTNQPYTDAILYQGDVYMTWADYLEDPTRESPAEKIFEDTFIKIGETFTGFSMDHHETSTENMHAHDKANDNKLKEVLEGARYNYASLIESSRKENDLYISKILKYFIAIGNAKQVINITNKFLAQETLHADPSVIAELSGVLIDRADGNIRDLANPYKLLRMTVEAGSKDSGIFYQLARYHHYFGNPAKEEEILAEAVKAFKLEERPFNSAEDAPRKILSKQKLGQYIDTLIRSGEISDVLNKPVIARDFYTQAQKRYEEALASKRIPARASDFGRLYARIGDQLYFGEQNLEKAQEYYLKALANQYGANPNRENFTFNRPHQKIDDLWQNFQDLSYKLGYIKFNQALSTLGNENTRQRLQKEAVSYFVDANGIMPSDNIFLLQALGNSYIEIGNYEAAIGQYLPLYIKLKQNQLDARPFLPSETKSHSDLRTLMYVTTNNMGVAYYKMYQNQSEHSSDYLAQAQLYMSEATVIAQEINRDRETNLPQNVLIMNNDGYVTNPALITLDNGETHNHGIYVKLPTLKVSQLNMTHILGAFPTNEVYQIPALYKDMKVGSVMAH